MSPGSLLTCSRFASLNARESASGRSPIIIENVEYIDVGPGNNYFVVRAREITELKETTIVTIQSIEKQLMKLDVAERAKLASTLLSSLDDLTHSENEKLWAEEAYKRHTDIVNGKTKPRPSEVVLKTARGRQK